MMACLAAGFISGWTIKECVSRDVGFVNKQGGVIRVHDTIKIRAVEYRIIPGRAYKVDSIVIALNQAWKDSLKNLYGKGKFEAKFAKEDNLGKREITLESRIPVDPEAEIIFTEELKLPEVFPKRRFGICGGAGYEMKNGFAGIVGLKYYVLDFKYLSLTCIAEGRYKISNREWEQRGRIEAEVCF
jgi:hypothetical protein